jgi:protein TonB
MSPILLAPEKDSLRMGIGLRPPAAGAPSDAWKRSLGTNTRVTARFELLPEEKKRWDIFGVMALLQVLFFVFLASLPLFFPERIKTVLNYGIMPLATPITEVPPPAPPVVKTTPEPAAVQPPPKPILKPVKLFAPKPVVHKIEEVKQLELKPVIEEAKLEFDRSMPKKPREEVKIGNLSSGSSAPATVNQPLNKVQTGGFGDTNGVPSPNANKRQNVNLQGDALLPPGAGYGNGTGGAKGVRGTVASTGFGNDVAVPPPATRKGSVQSSGFGDTAAPAEAPRKKTVSQNPDVQVSILSKPQPVYTAEGRNLKIEGEVVIDLVFLASGKVQVLRVAKGLGHGLDEAAMEAAREIKFKPAKRDGETVDFPARVRIIFQLAY